ncbi:MAG TPA: amidohydrolase [Candidatus Polarisedimenticolia bacterium]|nr:amidohydrolase [Candidatus Polarisedimenticolia bacterium]
MRARILATLIVVFSAAALTCAPPPDRGGPTLSSPSGVDSEITAFIGKIRAVDNHSHANSVDPSDSDQDALPLEVILPFEVPVQLRPDNPIWMAAYKALYAYPHADLSDEHLKALRDAMQRAREEQGDNFAAWALDQVGTHVLLANRIAMGRGLTPPRFRWVSYVDALMLPLSTKAEGAASPDRRKLFPLEEKLLRRYLSDLKVERLPSTLEAYLGRVVTPTLEAQRRDGCVAVKFEAALLRSLDFAEASEEAAARIYAKHVFAGEPSKADYKLLQDFLFRYIAREAGRLGMAVHIHSFDGPGNFFVAAGADPLLLEPMLNDAALRATDFVIVHGGGAYAAHAGSMLWKPNVYVDTSAMALLYTPRKLSEVLRDWLTLYPEKVLFGTDAAALGPDLGWEVSAWVATRNAREALAMALTNMMRDGEVSRPRAEEIATMVMRENAGKLYKLDLQ